MLCPFPGMDPWLEQSGIWSDLYTRLITALGNELGLLLRPHYYVGVENQTYITKPSLNGNLVGYPDVSVIQSSMSHLVWEMT